MQIFTFLNDHSNLLRIFVFWKVIMQWSAGISLRCVYRSMWLLWLLCDMRAPMGTMEDASRQPLLFNAYLWAEYANEAIYICISKRQSANIANQMATQLNQSINYCGQNFHQLKVFLILMYGQNFMVFVNCELNQKSAIGKLPQTFVLLKIISKNSLLANVKDQQKRNWE